MLTAEDAIGNASRMQLSELRRDRLRQSPWRLAGELSPAPSTGDPLEDGCRKETPRAFGQ